MPYSHTHTHSRTIKANANLLTEFGWLFSSQLIMLVFSLARCAADRIDACIASENAENAKTNSQHAHKNVCIYNICKSVHNIACVNIHMQTHKHTHTHCANQN